MVLTLNDLYGNCDTQKLVSLQHFTLKAKVCTFLKVFGLNATETMPMTELKCHLLLCLKLGVLGLGSMYCMGVLGNAIGILSRDLFSNPLPMLLPLCAKRCDVPRVKIDACSDGHNSLATKCSSYIPPKIEFARL